MDVWKDFYDQFSKKKIYIEKELDIYIRLLKVLDELKDIEVVMESLREEDRVEDLDSVSGEVEMESREEDRVEDLDSVSDED